MILLKANMPVATERPRGAEILHHLGRYSDSLARAGVLLAADGLHPLCEGYRISFTGDSRELDVVDPAEYPHELLAGYWLLQVRSREEAVEWVKRLPAPPGFAGVIELRRAVEPGDPEEIGG